jgi:hypothetical protein
MSDNGQYATPEDSAGGLLSKQQIVVASDIPTRRVPVPEWGGDVLVRGLTGAGRDKYFQSMAKVRKGQTVADPENATAKLCALCIIDPKSDQPMFTAAEVGVLGDKSAAALHRVEQIAMALSGLDDETMEELKKASTSTGSDVSTSA